MLALRSVALASVLWSCGGVATVAQVDPPVAAGCEAEWSPHAPPPALVDGLRATVVDLHEVHATLTFDVARQQASAVAEVRFAMGPDGGYPVLDLRQEVAEAALDGAPVTLTRRALSTAPASDVLVVRAALPACSRHVLRLAYPLSAPRAPGARAPRWLPGALRFDFDLSDLAPGRFLESWLPAGLVHDSFTLALDVTLTGAAEPHAVITNGALTALAPNRWRLTFPPHFGPADPLLAVRPAAHVTSRRRTVSLPGGQRVTLLAYRDAGVTAPAAHDTVLDRAAAWLARLVPLLGAYPHGDTLLIFETPPTDATGGMEYAGALELHRDSELVLAHELIHQWLGRGRRATLGRGFSPARAADGWLDEAWTDYLLGARAAPPPTVAALVDDPWARHTSPSALPFGRSLFLALDAHLGRDRLRDLLLTLLDTHPGDHLSTADFERHLACSTGDPRVRDLFARWLYALPDAAARPPLPCPPPRPGR